MRFLANENFPLRSIRKLREEGFDVVAVIEDFPGAKDAAILDRAVKEKRIILTFDRDYGELIYLQKKSVPTGVIYFRFDPSSPEEPGRMLIEMVGSSNITFESRFTVIDRKGVRQRPLP